MKHLTALVLATAMSGCGSDAAPTSWTLIWSDDFDGPAGSGPAPERWALEVGGDGWGNGESQFYTDRPDNVSLDGQGTLAITARMEDYQGRAYTSARLTTEGRFETTYGRIEARMQLPVGQGLWPAFWMLGSNVADVGWPASGEIDIMENRGAQPSTISGAVHGPGYSGGNSIIAAFSRPDKQSLATDFHVYAVEWDATSLRFKVDDALFLTAAATRLPTPGRWVFDHPFFVILNLAIGGTFGGEPDATTVFPQTLRVDYVRAYAAAPG
jgi:beta-glucanase (GH16 family)